MRRTPQALVLLLSSLTVFDVHAQDACLDAYREAQVERRGGRLLLARDHLGICARADCPEVARQDCSTWLDEVERLLPSVVVVLHDGLGGDLVDAVLTIDQRVVADRLDGRSITLDPGEHLIAVQPSGGRPALERRVLLTEGAKLQRIEFSLPVAAPPAPKEPAEPKLPEPPLSSSAPHPITWVLGGVGVASLGVFGGLAAWGLSSESELVRGGSSDEAVDAVEQQYLAADVMLGIGLASLTGSAIALIVWAAESSSTKSTSFATDRMTIRF